MNLLFINSAVIIEIIGYLGSIFVLVSFLLREIKQIRIINIIGATFFVVYGILTDTWPTAIMNLALVAVHIFYLIKLFKEKDINKEEKEEEN